MAQKSISERRKVGLAFILGWLIGGLLILGGLLSFVAKPGYGLVLILSGLSIFPPFWNKVKDRFNLELSGWLKLVIFLLLIGFSGSLNTPTVQTLNSSSNNAVQPDSVGIGQPVQDGDLVFTVLSVDKSHTIGNNYLLFSQRNSQGTFHLITLQITNKGSKTETFDASMAQVIDAQGNTYNHSDEGQGALWWQKGKPDLILSQVQPQLTLAGQIVFDLPDNIESPTLVVKGSLFSPGKKIRLY